MKLSGNTVFITGGTSGIGRALAQAFHTRGNKVIVAGRRKALLDDIAKQHPGIDTVELDIGDAAQIREVAALAAQRKPIRGKSNGDGDDDKCDLYQFTPRSNRPWKTRFQEFEARVGKRESAHPHRADE